MSTIHRFLSRKEKNSGLKYGKSESKTNAGTLNGLFEDKHTKYNPDKEEEKKVQIISQSLARTDVNTFKEADISYVLHSEYANGDTDKACELLVLLEDSEEGIINAYNPDVKLLGAVNREGVTCYLDALLFAMFARLGSFEAMLYNNFEDPPKKRLATLLRLWVNLLRTGKLITTDITKQIQIQLSNCGWKAAAEICQQDSSEAFTFITETMALPRLTLKMDIFHTGKEDTTDDHKFVNERLLELAVPAETDDENPITLEECLEMYFNNRIEVKRHLSSLERSSTKGSSMSQSSPDETKGQACHIEVAEVDEPFTPILQPTTSVTSARPTKRIRAPSIIREKYVEKKEDGFFDGVSPLTRDHGSYRVKKEVMMPAWQFFSLIPWYTNNLPSNDAQVAAHFSSARPILGICLKRYSILPSGRAVKRTTHIDIALEIGLPHFIHDDEISADGPAFGNFKLSLQSVVCHQGLSVDSGHYISLVRSPDPNGQGEDIWLRFDDLAAERVKEIDVQQFLKQSTEQTPYLLFYQVIPIEGDPTDTPDRRSTMSSPIMEDGLTLPPPSYSASLSTHTSQIDSGISGVSATAPSDSASRASEDSASVRNSAELSQAGQTASDLPRGRHSANLDRQPPSIAFQDSFGDGPGSPILIDGVAEQPSFSRRSSRYETDGPNTLTAKRRGSNGVKATLNTGSSKSRPPSQSGDKRLSHSLSRLAGRISRDRLSVVTAPAIPSSPSKERPPGEAPPPLVAQTQAALSGTVQNVDRDRSHEKGRQKRESKDKGKVHEARSKAKSKPDRECTIM